MRSTLIELFTRIVTVGTQKTNIYINGQDNSYPESVERVIDNSVTAKMSANKMADFIIGKGVSLDKTVNEAKKLSLYDILRMIAKSIAYQKGFYLHVNYDIEGNVNYLDVLPYTHCRISKEDDLGYKGLVYYSEKWHEDDFVFSRKKDEKWFYPYNNNQDVINAQRRRDAKGKKNDIKRLVQDYRGQVLFVSLEPEKVYPLSYVDSVFNDADSEYRTSIFKNTSLRNGFIGKVVATVLKSTDAKEKKKTEQNLQQLLGAENSGNILVFETEADMDGKLSDVVKFDKVEANINDKLFEYTEKSVSEKIMMAFNNIPPALVKSGNGALFSPSGDALEQMMLYYQNETEDERRIVEETLSKVLKEEIKIIPLIEKQNEPSRGLTDQQE